jgi:CheY-like chemotaxis protein
VSRILLVDDDIAEISAVKRVLTRAGHQPVLATNTNDALTAVEFQRPDLVIVGATCEGGRGIALTIRLADDEATSAIPLIVLGQSGDAATTATQVPRPVDPVQLAEIVKAAVGEGTLQPSSAPPRAAPAASPGARKSAADALLARASQLRQGPAAAKATPTSRLPAPAPVPRSTPAAARAAPPRPAPPRPAPPAAAEPAVPTFDQIGDDLEAVLKRAEEAERAHAAEKKARARQADRATVEAAQRAEAEEFAIAQTRAARDAEERVREGEQRRVVEEQRRAEEERKRAVVARKAEEERRRAEEARRRADEERERAEEARRQVESEQRRAEEERLRAEEGTRRALDAEQKVREEERRRAEAARRATEEKKRAEAARRKAEEEARRAAHAEELARSEGEARLQAEEEASAEKQTRRSLEAEVEQLRAQLERQRRDSETKLQSALDRVAAEGQAAEEARRLAAAQAPEEADAQVRSAIDSARAQMEGVRREREEERRRRAEAEMELERLAEATDRLATERAALAGVAPEPSADEVALRRRVQALRQREEEPPPEPADDRPTSRQDRQPHRTPTPDVADEPPPPFAPPAELRSGTLADLPAPRLLAVAAQARVGGRIDFQGDAARSIYFEEGRVVGATSGAPQERIEEVALRLGLLTRDQYRAAASAVASLPTRRAGVLLLERGYLKPHELTSLVRRRTEEVLFGLFADEGARFRWAPEHVPADERAGLEREPLALAVEGVRRRWLSGRLDAVLGGAGTLLAPLPGGPPLAEFGLSPEERRLVQLADGLRTLDEILSASPLDSLTSRQVLAGLTLTGALAIRVLQAGRPTSAAATAIDLARVRDKLDQARRADYFTILGLTRACTPHEVREAADRLLAEFDPRRYPVENDEDLAARLEEIRRVLQDAREVLAEDELREAYVEGL